MDILEFFINVARIYLSCARDAMLLGVDQIAELSRRDIVKLHHH